MTDGVVRFLQNMGLPAVAKESESGRLTAMRRTILFPEYLYSLGLASQAERNRKFILKIEAQDQGVPYKRENGLISMDGFYFKVPVPSDPVMLSMKLSAILSRGKGRDFYDAKFLMHFTSPDYDFLSRRCGISSHEALQGALSKKLAEIEMEKKSRDFEYLIFDKAKSRMILDFKV